MDSISSVQAQNTLFNQLTEKNLDSLRRSTDFGKARSEKEMEKVARDFESVFINKLFETMRKGIPKSGLIDSHAIDTFQSMMDEEMSKEMSTRKGLGMGEMIYNDLSKMNKKLRGESFSSEIQMSPKSEVKLGE
jgi:peptidoglycan hydrolase FlgJ